MRLLAAILLLCAFPALADVAVYYPNSTNCTAFNSVWATDPPIVLTGDVVNGELTSDQKNTISTDDDNSVTSTTGTGTQASGVRVLCKVVEDEAQISQLKWTVKAWALGGSYSVYGTTLAGWNYDGTAFTAAQNDVPNGANKVTVILTITVTPGQYVDATGYVSLAIFQTSPPGAGGFTYVYYVQLEVTYSAAAPAVPQTVITTTSVGD